MMDLNAAWIARAENRCMVKHKKKLRAGAASRPGSRHRPHGAPRPHAANRKAVRGQLDDFFAKPQDIAGPDHAGRQRRFGRLSLRPVPSARRSEACSAVGRTATAVARKFVSW